MLLLRHRRAELTARATVVPRHLLSLRQGVAIGPIWMGKVTNFSAQSTTVVGHTRPALHGVPVTYVHVLSTMHEGNSKVLTTERAPTNDYDGGTLEHVEWHVISDAFRNGSFENVFTGIGEGCSELPFATL